MNDDFRDLLVGLHRAGVRFLVVGAHAMAVHGVPRSTGDLDVWIESTEDNAARAWGALREFGAPVEALGATAAEQWAGDVVANFARPPQGNDTSNLAAVASGECELTIANTYYLGRWLASSREEDRRWLDRLSVGAGRSSPCARATVRKTSPV